MDSEKSINSFEMKERIGHMIIYGTIIFFRNFFITFLHFYYAKDVFDFFNMVDFFQIFVVL